MPWSIDNGSKSGAVAAEYIEGKKPLIEQAIADANEAKPLAKNAAKGAESALEKATNSEGKAIDALEKARTAKIVSETVKDEFDRVVAEAGSNNPEVVQARGGEVNLNARFEKTAAQLAEKAKQTDLNSTIESVITKAEKVYVDNKLVEKRDKNIPIEIHEFGSSAVAAMTGNTTASILSVPRKSSVTQDKTTFITVGKNVFNKAKVTNGKTLTPSGNGVPQDSATASVSDFTPIDPNTGYIANKTLNISFYTADKTFISHSGVASGTAFATPINAEYMRYSYTTSSTDTLQVEKGSNTTAYESYKEVLNGISVTESNLPENLISRIPSSDTNKNLPVLANRIIRPKNLVDKSKIVQGHSLSGGSLSANASFAVLTFVDVEASSNYVVNKTVNFAQYDQNKNFISQSSGVAGTIFTTAPNCKYVQISFSITSINTVQLEKGTVQTVYDEYFKELVRPFTTLEGKVGVGFGDSITQLTTYPQRISRITGCNYYNCGFGATRISKNTVPDYPYSTLSMSDIVDALITNDWSLIESSVQAVNALQGDTVYQVIYERLRAIDFSKVNFITFMYGTNDMNNSGAVLGTETSMNPYEINGALNYVISKLQTKFPHIKLYAMAPIFRQNVPGMDGNSDDVAKSVYLYEIADSFVKAGKRHHIPVKDNYNESGINRYTAPYYLSDGTHLSAAGIDLMTENVLGFLTSK